MYLTNTSALPVIATVNKFKVVNRLPVKYKQITCVCVCVCVFEIFHMILLQSHSIDEKPSLCDSQAVEKMDIQHSEMTVCKCVILYVLCIFVIITGIQ